ncbi:MAG: asparagine synthase (glutamine-hydrolyzing) [Myxococcales bacterium]|nr:asparagine synthase (glutamine-hydrolyzing) [Myxococcales bacterium]
MCGIAGVWNQDGAPVDVDRVARMRDTLTHRGPDDAALSVEADGAVALAHRRLSILDLSPAGRMPMRTEDGRVSAVFNGEVYNFRDLRAQLEALGHSFRSTGDSEVVLRAFAQWDTGCFERFNGMFAIAVWDDRTRRLVLARDPMGQKPLYYLHAPGRRLIFGSTLAPLLSYEGARASVDREAAYDYMRFGFVPDERSMLEGARQVPPGACAVFERGEGPTITRYFDLARYAAERSTERPARKSVREHTDALHALLQDAVDLRLVSDVPLGAFLSGGIDSTLIVALMAARDRAAVQTFTIGFDDPRYDESAHAKRLSEHFGVRNTVRVLSGRDVLAQLPDVVRYFDEPMADYSVLPTLAVSKLAREHVTVALTGDGADELFAGYKYYLAQYAFERYAAAMPRVARERLAGLAGRVGHPGVARVLRRSGVVDPAHFFGLGGFYRGATSQSAVPRLLGADNAPEERVAAFLRAHPLRTSVESGMLYDALHTLPGAWLHKVDRASMAVSLEARSPFLDRRVVEMAFGLPLSMRLRGPDKKYILRRLLARYAPPLLTERPKQGFTAPVATWLRRDLRDAVEDALSARRVRDRGLFEPQVVRALVDEHMSGRHDHAQALWALLVLEWWTEHHLHAGAGQADASGAPVGTAAAQSTRASTGPR